MTLFRSLFGCTLAFGFDVWRSCVELKGAHRNRMLCKHFFGFLGGTVTIFTTYHLVTYSMIQLREHAPRAFACDWEDCEEQLRLPLNDVQPTSLATWGQLSESYEHASS